MKEYIDEFRLEVEMLYKKLYDELDLLIDNAMFNMSFENDDPEGNYALLENVMINFIQDQIVSRLDEYEES